MSFRLMAIIGALIGGLMLPASADASPARTITALNMRSGPGVGYAIITVIPGGAWVEVSGYTGGWCGVDWRGYRGWASCRYLSGAVAPRYVYPAPSFGFYLGVPVWPWYYDYDRRYRPHYTPPPRPNYRYDRDHRVPWFWPPHDRDRDWRR